MNNANWTVCATSTRATENRYKHSDAGISSIELDQVYHDVIEAVK